MYINRKSVSHAVMRKNTFPVIQYNLLILLMFHFHQLPFKPTKCPEWVFSKFVTREGGGVLRLSSPCFLSSSVLCIPSDSPAGIHWEHESAVMCLLSVTHILSSNDTCGRGQRCASSWHTRVGGDVSLWTPGFPHTGPSQLSRQRRTWVTGLQGQLREGLMLLWPLHTSAQRKCAQGLAGTEE